MTTARKFKFAGVIALVSAIVIVVLQNQETVATRVLLIDVEMPMAVLLFVMLAVGFLLGLLVSARMAAADRAKTTKSAKPKASPDAKAGAR